MKKYLILLTLAVLAACAKEAADDLRPADGRYSMTVQASKVGTKALALDGSNLNASWTQGDKVYVHNDTKNADLEGYLEAQSSGASTTLKGELTGTIAAGDYLTLKFCNPSYASQTGTLAYIAANCDYATATVTVKSIDGGNVTINGSSATFINQQAVVKFTLKASDGTTPINTTQLTVSDGTSTISLSDIPAATYTTNGNGVLYVAFPAAGSAKTITLNVADGSKHFVYEKSGVTFTNSNYYEITVKFGALSGAGTEADPYLISSVDDWNYLADKVGSGTNYSGKFIRLTANIGTAQAPITRMVGIHSDTESNCRPFSGTFDGQGHTLTVDYTNHDYETRSAPFSRVSGATIRCLIVAGNCGSAGRAAGIVGECDSVTSVINCISSVTVSGGPFIGGISIGGYYHIEGCLFNGTINATGSSGGLVGYGEPVTQITNCLFAPQAGSSISGGTFFHTGSGGVTLTNSYYFTLLGDAQGKQARSITAGTDVTISGLGASTGTYNVSGITAYSHGIKYNGVYYAGKGDEVSLSLSHGAAPSGYTFNQYTVTGGGSLSDPTSNSPTLTMTDANQTINVEWAFNTQTFNYTGAVQTFTVPATGYYTLECYGAQGGYASSGLGGKGGLSQLTYSLTQGDVLYIYVGGQGECIDGSSAHPEGGYGGWNGGGKGGTGVAWGGGNGDPYNGGGGGGGATHIATSAIGAITSTTDFNANHDGLLLIAGGGGGGLSWGPSAGGVGGGDTGGNGHRQNDEWNIAWNNGTLSCGRDGMLSSNGGGSCEGCGGGGGGYQGGNTWTVSYNASNQSYSGAGGSSWGETTYGINYSTTSGGATAGGNGKAVITWYGTTYPVE